jgi:hypothetical protein
VPAKGSAVLLLALCVLGAGAAVADEDRAAADLEAARRAIEALEYPEAVNVLEALLRRGDARPAVTARAYELLATAAASSGEEAQAVWAYERLLALEPGWQPAAEQSPRLAAALERARAALPEGATLSIVLERPPTAAAGRPLTVTLVTRSDGLGLVRGARVRHRPVGARTSSQVTVRGAAPLEVVVPASSTTGRAVELWAAALDEHGNELAWVGSADAPLRVPIGPAAAPRSGNGPRGGDEGGSSVLGRWWSWTGVVALVAGGVVLGVVLTRPEPECEADRACFDVRVEAGAL